MTIGAPSRGFEVSAGLRGVLVTPRAIHRSTESAPGALWRRVEFVETGESVDVRNPAHGHVLRALALLSESEVA